LIVAILVILVTESNIIETALFKSMM